MVCELAGLEPDRLLEWARALQLESGWARQRGTADEFIATIFATHRTCAVGQPWKFPRPKNQTVGGQKVCKINSL